MTSWGRSGRTGRQGFTLIELMTVIVIVALLSALLVSAAKWSQAWALQRRARGNMQQIMAQVAEVDAQTGAGGNPFGTSGTMTGSPMYAFQSKDVARYDPWGKAYRIDTDARGEVIGVRSFGPDGIEGTRDDLYLERY